MFKPILLSEFCVDDNYTYFQIYVDIIIDKDITNFIIIMHDSSDKHWKFCNRAGWHIVYEQFWSWQGSSLFLEMLERPLFYAVRLPDWSWPQKPHWKLLFLKTREGFESLQLEE